MLRAIAWGFVLRDGSLLNGRGITTNRVQAGHYQLTLSDSLQVDDTEMMITVTLLDGEPRANNIYVRDPSISDLVKEVKAYTSAGVLTDTAFYFKIEQLQIL